MLDAATFGFMLICVVVSQQLLYKLGDGSYGAREVAETAPRSRRDDPRLLGRRQLRRLSYAASAAPPQLRRLSYAASAAPPQLRRLSYAASAAPPQLRRFSYAAPPGTAREQPLGDQPEPDRDRPERLTRDSTRG